MFAGKMSQSLGRERLPMDKGIDPGRTIVSTLWEYNDQVLFAILDRTFYLSNLLIEPAGTKLLKITAIGNRPHSLGLSHLSRGFGCRPSREVNVVLFFLFCR